MSPMQCAFPAYSASTEFIKPTTQQLQRPTDRTVPGSSCIFHVYMHWPCHPLFFIPQQIDVKSSYHSVLLLFAW
jgi:hypothetical protein